MMEQLVAARRSGWMVWLWWVLANAAGGLIGIPLSVLLSLGLFRLNFLLGVTLLGGMLWAVLGSAQWLILRRYLPAASNTGAYWGLGSTLAGGGAVLAASLVFLYAASVFGPAGNADSPLTSDLTGVIVSVVVISLVGAGAGLIVGVGQALVLRSLMPSFSRQWIVTNGIGLAVGVPLAVFVGLGLSAVPTVGLLQALVSPVLIGTIAVTVAAAITGLSLIHVLGAANSP